MPYVLSPPVTTSRAGVWGEGKAYETANLYAIDSPEPPFVHYDEHLLRPHSVTHAEAPGHVDLGGGGLDPFFESGAHFWGPALVVQLPAGGYRRDGDRGAIHRVTAQELAPHLEGHEGVGKILLAAEDTPVDDEGYHAVDHALVLAEDAARMLAARSRFDLFGTSYRSTDHQPGRPERPIHRIVFQRAVILEYLDLRAVPAGRYVLCAFPVRLAGATESPVTPVLFTPDELAS